MPPRPLLLLLLSRSHLSPSDKRKEKVPMWMAGGGIKWWVGVGDKSPQQPRQKKKRKFPPTGGKLCE